MAKSRAYSDKLQTFLNDHLREDLGEYEHQLNKVNDEILEFIQLKNMAENIKEHFKLGLKTQMNIGGNFFMQAKVKQPDKMVVNVGLNCYVELSLEETIKFADFKIRVLNKHAEIIREESIKTRAKIKLTLMCIGDEEQLNLLKTS